MADPPIPLAATNGNAPGAHGRRRLLGPRKPRQRKGYAALYGLKPAEVCFKCAYAERSGCTEGTDGSDRGYSGAWHAAGQLRASRTYDHKHFEQYCAAHWPEIMESTSGGRVARPLTAAAAAGASSAAGPGSRSASSTSGAGADIDQVPLIATFPRPGGAEVQLKRLSDLFFSGQSCPTKESADAPRVLSPRVQRHTELTDKAVREAVAKVVHSLRKGMPRLTKDGSLSDSGKWGDAWKDQSKWPGAYMRLEDSGIRAMRCKGKGDWTAESKELARIHHLVTGTVVFVMPEVFDRQALLAAKEFQVIRGDRVVGARLICPTCRSNAHTSWASWSDIRAVHSMSGENLLICSARHRCLGPECQAVTDATIAAMKRRDDGGEARVQAKKKGADSVDTASDPVKAALRRGDIKWEGCMSLVKTLLKGGVSFTISDQSYMRLLPAAVQAKYDFECFGKGGADHALLDLTVTGAQPVAALHRQAKEAYDFKQRQRHTCWNVFAAMHKGSGVFPELGVVGSGTLLSGPSQAYMETYCSKSFQEVKPLLKRELCNLSPGKAVSLDATFRLAKIATGDASCIVFLLGEFGHIIGWAALRSDKWSNLLPLLHALRARLDRLGTLNDVVKAFADTCCEGKKDVTVHLCVDIFPNVKRTPFADLFHKVQIISTHTLSAHPLHAALSREVGTCIAAKHEPDVHRVAAYIIKERGVNAEEAMALAGNSHYRRFVRTHTPPDCAARLGDVYEKYLKLSNECVQRGERPLYQEKRGASQSTLSAFQNVIACANKGCFDMDDVKDSYVCDRIGEKTELAHLKKLGGTGANEAAHSQANGRIATIASRMSEARSEREIWLWIHQYNRTCDENRGIAKPDFLRNYWDEEKIRRLAGNVEGPSPGGNLRIPPELEEKDMELMGYDYLSLDQDKVAKEIAEKYRMDWSSISAAALPAVSGEDPLPGENEFEREGEQAQVRIAPATSSGAASISFGRHGGRGCERIAGAGGNVGSGAGEMAVTGLAPAGRDSTAVGGSEAGAPRAATREGEAFTGAGSTRSGSTVASATALGKRPAARTGGTVGAGAGARAASPADTRAGPRASGVNWTSRDDAAPTMGQTAGAREVAGPRDGQGRVTKFRRASALTDTFAMPATADDKKLACAAFGAAKATGLRGEEVWEAAAAEYNSMLGQVFHTMAATGQPSKYNYSFNPIDRSHFKRYWEEMSAASVLPMAGAVFERAGAGTGAAAAAGAGTAAGPAAGAAATAAAGVATGVKHRKLTPFELREWSGNKLKRACRQRGITVSNMVHRDKAAQKLSDAGWVASEGELA